ncbi:MAG: hypothetical protein R3181_13325 [Rubricoccaceae bacterium]|nr:hypothetical protein [Rubricoccaceae bacterium]
MADTEGASSGATTAIVGVVAIVVLLVLVWFMFLRGGAAPEGGTDIDVTIDPGDAVEEIVE